MRTVTATEIVYGAAYTPHPYSWEPQHPALAIVQWECERTDIHGVIGGQFALGLRSFDCACGWKGPECSTEFDAAAAIISHALNNCAACGGEKPATTVDGRMDAFPRCSRCAF